MDSKKKKIKQKNQKENIFVWKALFLASGSLSLRKSACALFHRSPAQKGWGTRKGRAQVPLNPVPCLSKQPQRKEGVVRQLSVGNPQLWELGHLSESPRLATVLFETCLKWSALPRDLVLSEFTYLFQLHLQQRLSILLLLELGRQERVCTALPSRTLLVAYLTPQYLPCATNPFAADLFVSGERQPSLDLQKHSLLLR